MKVIISYPPLDSSKGTPLLSQNRQFQYFNAPTYIYPVVPAQAATLLKEAGFDIVWNDCIAEGWNRDIFFNFVRDEKPDLIVFETKTPVIKQHWSIINELKTRDPRLKTILLGDHVTALPEESFENSQVDYVLTGGDYDFLLLNLCKHLKNSHNAQRTTQYEALEPGIYYRDKGQIKNTGKFELNHDLNSLPFIDRDLTKWQLYAYNNGNYKKTPGTYIMSGRDCWWGRCSFCSWTSLYPKFRSRKVDNVLNEIGALIDKYGTREVMDDSGTFPIGDWLNDFCNGSIKKRYNKKIYLDCNMRFGASTEDDFRLMKKANFRLLLFGLESANQKTLDRLNKNLKVENVVEDCKLATKAGLFPHITIMFGYPWETYEDCQNTLKLGKWLLKKGYAYTMQATVVIPYPGTLLFEECKKEGLLLSFDWDNYDMKQTVMRMNFDSSKVMEMVQQMYRVSFQPEFLLRKLFSIKDPADLNYYLRAAKKSIGHVFDFSNSHIKCSGK